MRFIVKGADMHTVASYRPYILLCSRYIWPLPLSISFPDDSSSSIHLFNTVFIFLNLVYYMYKLKTCFLYDDQ